MSAFATVHRYLQLSSQTFTILAHYQLTVTLEPCMQVGCGTTSEERHTQPADVLAANWTMGKPAAFDFTVTSPLTSSNLSEVSVTAGSVAFAAEERKH